MVPAYISAYKKGVLDERISCAQEQLADCNMCPRRCGVNRLNGNKGICKTGFRAMVSSYNSHYGEESPLVGKNGSGTIFFTNCNLLCDFCQNFDISHDARGNEVSDEELALMMLQLQRGGCHNINFVTPTHVIPQILSALKQAVIGGLNVPLVYNSGGYDLAETLKLLDGIVDIYMPDFKFWDSSIAARVCNAVDYPEIAKLALKEMHMQVGDLVINKNGIAERGLLVRHLVLPDEAAGTKEIVSFISEEISSHTYLNVMSQYYPCGKAYKHQELSRRITSEEYYQALMNAKEAGITRLDNLYFK